MNDKKTISITLRIPSLDVPDDFPEEAKTFATTMSRSGENGEEIFLARVQFPEDETALLQDLQKWSDAHSVRMDLRFRVYEWGMGSRSQGGAQVACGLHGSPLVSVGGSIRMGEPHAIFWVQRALLVTFEHQGSWQHGSVRLLELDTASGITSTLLWEFEAVSPDEFSTTEFNSDVASSRNIEFPDDAAEAVYEKAHRKSREAIFARKNERRASRDPRGERRNIRSQTS